MIKQVAVIETKLERIFKNLPNISNSTKTSITKVLPWFAIIFGTMQVIWAFDLWNTLYGKTSIGNVLYLSESYNGVEKLGLFAGIIILSISAATLLMSYKPLMKNNKKGWDLLFLSALLNVIYSLIIPFIISAHSNVVMSIVVSGVGFYVLFQVKTKYKKSKK
ncbi:MAG: hypothetical protein WCK69_00490 [Candidatus Saccharibacteria bacterium]